VWPDEVLQWLRKIGRDDVFKLILALHTLLGQKAIHGLRANPSFRVPDGILGKIHAEEGRVGFTDEVAKSEFEDIAKRDIVAL